MNDWTFVIAERSEESRRKVEILRFAQDDSLTDYGIYMTGFKIVSQDGPANLLPDVV